MNDTTELNSELLSADARGRKHIPVAVFAVITIHVVLFVLLLIAAGCRSTARAKANQPEVERLERAHPTQEFMQARDGGARTPKSVSLPPIGSEAPTSAVAEPVVATEPQVETEVAAVTPGLMSPRGAQVVQVPPVLSVEATEPGTDDSPREKRNTKPLAKSAALFHLVQSGDTVDKIARLHGTTIEAIKSANKLKNHLIYPGQKLLIKPESGAGSTAQLKSRKSTKGEA